MADKILIVHETRKDSVISDLFTFGSLIAAVGAGVLLNSQALQWIAGLSWIGFSIGAGARRYTIAEARQKLDQLEKEEFGQ